MAYEAVDSLQQYLRVILQCHDDLTTPQVKQRIISIHDKAVVLQFNLKRFPQQETIKEVATATEGIIQYLFSPEYLSNCKSTDQSVGLSDQLGKLAKVLESTVEYVVDRCKSNDVRKPSGSPSSSSRSPTELIVRDSNWLGRLWGIIKSAPSDSPSMHPPTATSKYVVVGAVPTNKDVVVGLDEDMIQMRCRLIGHDGLKVLPIVGMAGIGKSLLAKNIYHDPFITFHFDIRVWFTISQDYSTSSILSQLLASVKGKVAEKRKIYKILSGRRYLIVMDDMWSAKAWDQVQWLFPKNNNGSRIILTTRLMDVATYVATGQKIHMMRFLDDKQSWCLFNHKVFGDQGCPLELQSVGEKIVKGCGGLPLSIVHVAGLLSKIPRTPKLWKQIEGNDGQLGSILSLSYNHLPIHLRKCFLYMAAFPQDYEIHASELIRLWLAEGFLERKVEFEWIYDRFMKPSEGKL